MPTSTSSRDYDAEWDECLTALTAVGWTASDAEAWTQALLGPHGPNYVDQKAHDWHEAGFRDAATALSWLRHHYDPSEARRWHVKGFTPPQANYLYEMCEYLLVEREDNDREPRVMTWEQQAAADSVALLDSPAPAGWILRYVEAGHTTPTAHEELEVLRAQHGRQGLADFLDALAANRLLVRSGDQDA